MAVIDKRHRQKISTPKQFLFIMVWAFILLVLPFTSCQKPEKYKKHQEIAEEELDSSHLIMRSRDVKYLPDLEDIPLPPGFTPSEDKKTIYYTPSGRIIEVYAEGNGSEEDIEKFYSETLPNLGWERDAGFYKGGLDMRFNRAGEQLRVNIKTDALEMGVKTNKEYKDEYKFRLQDDTAKMTLRFSLYPEE